jgi:hypothetical protein
VATFAPSPCSGVVYLHGVPAPVRDQILFCN